MTLELEKEQITKKEERYKEPYVGYISPNGELVNFNVLFGEPGHDNWVNIVSQTFIRYVSYAIIGTSISEYKNKYGNYSFIKDLEYPGMDERVIRGLGSFLETNYYSFNEFMDRLNLEIEELKQYRNSSEYTKFKYDLLLFFQKAYQNRTFFETIGRTIKVISKNDYILTNAWRFKKDSDRIKEECYRQHLKKELMQYFKDICVQYLCYDSIERFKPNGEIIEIPSNCGEDKSYFDELPRIITTSTPLVNERFFKYLAMGWEVHRIPRFFYNMKTQKFEQEPIWYTWHYNEREEKFKEKIKYLRRLRIEQRIDLLKNKNFIDI